MVSRSGLYYLLRKRVFIPTRPRPVFQTDVSQLNRRQVYNLPALLPPDSPKGRVLTQKEEVRIPYLNDSNCPDHCIPKQLGRG